MDVRATVQVRSTSSTPRCGKRLHPNGLPPSSFIFQSLLPRPPRRKLDGATSVFLRMAADCQLSAATLSTICPSGTHHGYAVALAVQIDWYVQISLACHLHSLVSTFDDGCWKGTTVWPVHQSYASSRVCLGSPSQLQHVQHWTVIETRLPSCTQCVLLYELHACTYIDCHIQTNHTGAITPSTIAALRLGPLLASISPLFHPLNHNMVVVSGATAARVLITEPLLGRWRMHQVCACWWVACVKCRAQHGVAYCMVTCPLSVSDLRFAGSCQYFRPTCSCPRPCWAQMSCSLPYPGHLEDPFSWEPALEDC
jgi:hypothetical protein